MKAPPPRRADTAPSWTAPRLVLVQDGPCDVFAHRRRGDTLAARRYFVARLGPGSLLPIIKHPDTALELVPLPGSTLLDVDGPDPALDLISALDQALLAVADGVRGGPAPVRAEPLVPHELLALDAGASLTGSSHVWWLRLVGGRARRNGGGAGQELEDGDVFLLGGRDWVTTEDAATVESMSTRALAHAGLFLPALLRHLRSLGDHLAARMDAEDAMVIADVRRRKDLKLAYLTEAARAAVHGIGERSALPTRTAADSRPLAHRRAIEVLRTVCADPQLRLSAPSGSGADQASCDGDEAAIRAVARASGVHLRDLVLPARWWRSDFGRLLGWRTDADDGLHAVVLEPGRRGYRLIDPVTLERVAVTPRIAAALREVATSVQVPLPTHASLRHLLVRALRGNGRDIRGLMSAGILAALLGVAGPLATGKVLGSLAGGAETNSLTVIVSLVAVAGLVGALCTAVQNLRLLRIEGRVQAAVEMSLWDRLIRLPVAFFHSRSSGQLASAVLGVSYVRAALSGISAQAVGAAALLLVDLVVITVLSPVIGAVVAGLVLLSCGAVWILGVGVVRRGRASLPSEHRAASLADQLFTGIKKIKLAGAEDRAYVQWVSAASKARSLLLPARRIQATIAAISTSLPIAGQLLLFLVLAGPLRHDIGIATFFTLNTAFTMLIGALLVLVSASVEIFAAIPRMESLSPVLDEVPEVRPELHDPGDLSGEVELVGITFGYTAGDPPLLENLNLRIRPGEFVALVGPSGSGKSTVLRLLLGFESPQAGSVLFDGRDLATLDPQAVRRQLGVVLQDGRLFAGSIRDNISGVGQFNLQQVWAAARMAGLDDDIDRLPMGMSTTLPPGGGTLSVGQRQRLLIARALIHHPRVLLFDEATSALDNRTQEIVTASTRQLAATRIVLAHRLSTIRDADRIVVMDRGAVVQQGSFAELLAERDGMFHRLARRQMLDL